MEAITILLPADNLVCPYCQAKADGVTGKQDKQPKINDITLCSFCLNIALFKPDGNRLQLMKPTAEEIEMIERDMPGVLAEIGLLKAVQFPLWRYCEIKVPTDPN
jgi:hypothetical protein